MQEQINRLTEECLTELEVAADESELNNAKVKFLGKNGRLTEVLRKMKDLPADVRPLIGKIVNDARERIEGFWNKRVKAIETAALNKRLEAERVDITLPVKATCGALHPLTIVRNSILEIFVGLGFEVTDGPEIETEYYNFEALNIPADHPARDTQDTFYITDEILLRPQTSAMQIRTMERTKPPIKMLNPGRVYRADEVDATHSPMFHQIEGLVVDKNLSMCDLRGTLDTFIRRFFGDQTRTRYRPSFFPFTEPSVEVDASCASCGGSGCRVCKGTGWIEILGAGMVNRAVLRNCGIDPDEYCGFAFGMGLDRITTIKYGISDLRVVFENDARFLRQFR